MRETVVLTISRQLGSGGSYIGQVIARELRLKYVDRDILRQAAELLGVEDESELEALEERRPGWWARIGHLMPMGAPDAPFVPPPPSVHEGHVYDTESRIIREIAAREDAVIVGRGAPHILREHRGVIRLFVHAPEAFRVARVQEAYAIDETAAREMVQGADRQRAAFVTALVGRPWTDARLYDMTFDTSVVPMGLAAELVGRVVRQRLDARGSAARSE